MKKIACVGYHATGAGVIDDLLREFDNVTQGQYEVECRVLQDPDGISDLEYNLVENPHRLNSGFAVKRFENYVKRTSRSYNRIFGKQWQALSKAYAQRLVKLTYRGYWHGDIWLLNPLLRLYHKCRRLISRLFPQKPKIPASFRGYFPWLNTYHLSLDEATFLEYTRDYMDSLCAAMNPENKEFVVLDQPYAPGNLGRYARYMRDTKVIVVDRDPRDVYIYIRSIREAVMPADPYAFCQVYRDARTRISQAPEGECLYLTFEDLMYHYEENVKKVMDFVGLTEEHHVRPRTRFDPNVSVKNTKLWEKHPEYSKEIQIIEKELADLLYPYQ